jgi:hypothetical protein
MTTTLLLILIPLAFVAGGFVAYKGVQLGLRWQIEVRQEKPPTLEVPNPITPIIEHKQEKETANIFNEWVHGTESR